MAKILMSSIYARIKDRQQTTLSEAKAEGDERISYPFVAFSQDLRSDDLVTSAATIKSKWLSAIADGVIEEIPGPHFSRALLNIRMLEYKGRFYIRPSVKAPTATARITQEASE